MGEMSRFHEGLCLTLAHTQKMKDSVNDTKGREIDREHMYK